VYNFVRIPEIFLMATPKKVAAPVGGLVPHEFVAKFSDGTEAVARFEATAGNGRALSDILNRITENPAGYVQGVVRAVRAKAVVEVEPKVEEVV
jgi:hypothetical protein